MSLMREVSRGDEWPGPVLRAPGTRGGCPVPTWPHFSVDRGETQPSIRGGSADPR